MKYLITSLVLVIIVSFSFAQNKAEDQLGTWATISGAHRISKKLSISSLVQLWLYEETEHFNFIVLIGSLDYHVSPKLNTSIAIGYADIDGGYNNDKSHTYENRLSEQISYKHRVFSLPVDHRFRVEQRFFHKLDIKSWNNRLRYRFGTKIELNSRLFIRFHDEILSTIQKDINTENRLYTALGINVSKSAHLQIGYLNRKINGQNLHRLQMAYFFKSNHIKRERTK